MSGFELPKDLMFNRGAVDDPREFAKSTGSASWLFLVGEEFASMPGGMSYEQVQAAVPASARVISDPPRDMTLELARQHVEALDSLPRPTMITCRTGPRASAVAYMYAGLRSGASPDDVVAAAERDGAPFTANPLFKDWVRESMESLRGTEADNG